MPRINSAASASGGRHPLSVSSLTRALGTELMHVGNVQTLKKMNVETYQTGTNKVIGITYLEFDEPKRKEP